MAADKKTKTSKKRIVAKKGIKIQALISQKLHLTRQEKKSLKQALKAAGETFVEKLKSEEVIVITANDEPFFG